MIEAGTGSFGTAAVVAGGDAGAFHVQIAAAGITRDAETIADRAVLPFSQAATGRRTNTDLGSFSLLGALGYTGSSLAAPVSLLRVATRRGIVPEVDRDPALTAPRYC
jgi:iron complex outermembrane receptor protein